jgi:hypothetical protein
MTIHTALVSRTNSPTSETVLAAIRQASVRTGVDFGYLLQNARTESSLDSRAKADTSSAQGLYQFVESTWLEQIDKHGAEHGLQRAAEAVTRDAKGNPVVADPGLRGQILALRNDPRIAALMAAELAQDNKAGLENALQRKVNNTELYLAHFLGTGGATRLLSQRDTAPQSGAAQWLPEAAESNQHVFFAKGRPVTVDQLYQRFAAKFGEADGTPAIAAPAPAAAKIAAVYGQSLPAPAGHVASLRSAAPAYRAVTALAEAGQQQLAELAYDLLRALSFPNEARPETALNATVC